MNSNCRLLMGFIQVLLCCLMAQLSFAQVRPELVTVKGTVEDKLSALPLPGVRLQCGTAGTISGAQGEFLLEQEEGSECRLEAQLDGYQLVNDGNFAIGVKAGKTLRFANSQEERRLRLAMVKLGRISGRVSTREGKPVAGQPVFLVKKSSIGKAVMFSSFLEKKTDDAGNYFFHSLPPGAYLVLAHQPPVEAADGEEEYRSTFAPSSEDADSALTISLRSGQEVSDIDVELLRAPRFQIRGQITGLPKDQDASNLVRLRLTAAYSRLADSPMSLEGYTVTSAARSTIEPDGSFTLYGVAPGRYHLLPNLRYSSIEPVELEVIDKDVEKVFVDLPLVYPAKFYFHWEDRSMAPAEDSVVMPALQSLTGNHGHIPVFGGNGDNTSSSAPVPAGWYQFRSPSHRSTFFIKNLFLNGQEVDPLRFQIPPQTGNELHATLSNKIGRISGTAPSPEARVTVTPVRWQPILPAAQWVWGDADYQGAFGPLQVTPGNYHVCAWLAPLVEFHAHMGTERFQQQTIKDCEAVEVPEGGRATVRLRKVISLN
jgi:hypothetical protein